MRVQVFKALWGMTQGHSVEHQLQAIAAAGYDGVECDRPAMPPQAWRELLDEHRLAYIGMAVADDAAGLIAELKALAPYRPVSVTCHTGRDKMSFEQGRALFAEVLRAERDLGLVVGHETHRRRLLYSPWSTAAYLHEFPELRLCADFSHWCVVCESLLEDMDDWLALACGRAVHVHSRVGYEQGPQAPDPRAPEYARHLARHEAWWDAIRRRHLADGAETMTITPEFGPPDYLHTLPYTRQPVADLWDVCLWMAGRIRRRWGKTELQQE